VSSHFEHILAGLHPLFSLPQELLHVQDNASSAVARMIMAAADALPMDQIFPIFLGALPLTVDHMEDPPVYQCLFQLLEAKHPVFQAHRPQVLAVLCAACRPDAGVEAELVENIAGMVKRIVGEAEAAGENKDALFTQVDQGDQALLGEILSS
jgi:hypothetical protein